MSTDEKAKSCDTCEYNPIPYPNEPCTRCENYDMWHACLTTSQQYAEELLKRLKIDHVLMWFFIKKSGLKTEHEQESCPTCQLIAKAEGRE